MRPRSLACADLQEPQTLLLWPNGAPAHSIGGPRQASRHRLHAADTTGPMTAVIVAPAQLSRALDEPRGTRAGEHLNALGIAAFVLRYRLGPQYHHPIELGDAQRAIRLVRSPRPIGTSRPIASA